MTKRTWHAFIAFLFPSAVFLQATEPLHWTVSTQSEFLEGELKGVSVTSDGKLILAPALEPLLNTEEAFVYSTVLDKSGNLHLGTGNNGKIFRIIPSGQGREWARLEEGGVYALAADSMNRIYAGTAPDGKVYRLNDQGEARVFYDPEEKYIWALAMDAQNNLFVGTGPKGVIYKVNPQGQGEVFYDSKETHVVSLTWDLNGNLLAGTAPGGLLFRISSQGSPFVIYDSRLQEIRSMAVDRYGNIYAAALSTPPSTGEKSGKPSSENLTRNAQQGEAETGAAAAAATVRVSGTGTGSQLEIYRIDKENLLETLYTSNDEVAFDLLVRSNGDLLVGTGNKGRIISISPRRFVTILLQCPEQQVTRLLEKGDTIYVATSNLGHVFQLLPRPSATSVYESKVLDAKMVAFWGTLRWRMTGSAPVKVYTRSGNTESPDQTWNDWSGPYTEPGGSRVQSPAARFLQWKIEFPREAATALTTRSNAVESVTVTYIQRNMPPQLTSISVQAPGVAFVPAVGNPGAGISPGGPDQAHLRSLPRLIRDVGAPMAVPPPRKIYTPGARSVSWSATDPNGDDLVYSIYYRTQEEETWKLLKEGLQDTYYTLDGLSFPDGAYFVRVVASDRPSNPPHQAQESELATKAFVIANSSPSIAWEVPQRQGNTVSMRFKAQTGESVVHQAEYSVDAGPWNILFPEDGIADSNSENYVARIENLTRGEHVVTVRMVDSVGNVGTGKIRVSIP